MKRKYPVSLFFLGILDNLIRYFLIGMIGLVLLIIGFAGVRILKIIGTIVLICYLLLCVIEQFILRHVALKESDNPEFNKIMNETFGVKGDKSDLSYFKKIMKIVEETKSQDKDSDN